MEESRMGITGKGSGWQISDALWKQIEPLLPPRKKHPLGCHNPRVPDRAAMTGIFFVLRTGCQWEALDATGICKHSSAHRRFTEWTKAGVFKKLWKNSLLEYDAVKGIDWRWLSMDGAMTKAPLGGEKDRQKPNRQSKTRSKAKHVNRRQRYSARIGYWWRKPA